LTAATIGILAHRIDTATNSDSRANEILTRHRVEIAGLGAAAFVAVVIVLLLA
jgi:hypothetical protein